MSTMKKILISTLVAVSAIFVSCSQKESLLPSGDAGETFGQSFNVLDESEVSGAELFTDVTAVLKLRAGI